MTTQGLQVAGIAAGIVLIAIGIGSIVTGLNGRTDVHDNLGLEKITGPRYDPQGHRGGSEGSGPEGRRAAHVLGRRYSRSKQQPRQVLRELHPDPRPRGHRRPHLLADGPVPRRADGKETSDKAAAGKDPNRPALPNSARNVWVTATALTTALNTSYFAESVACSRSYGHRPAPDWIGLLVFTVAGCASPASAALKTPVVPRSLGWP